MPVSGQKRHEGKALYSFGRATLYIDRGVSFVMMSDTQTWRPVSLDDLLKFAWLCIHNTFVHILFSPLAYQVYMLTISIVQMHDHIISVIIVMVFVCTLIVPPLHFPPKMACVWLSLTFSAPKHLAWLRWPCENVTFDFKLSDTWENFF